MWKTHYRVAGREIQRVSAFKDYEPRTLRFPADRSHANRACPLHSARQVGPCEP